MPLFCKQHNRRKPSYGSLSSTFQEKYSPSHNIFAGTTPQWGWTNSQCRRWLHTVCLTGLGLPPDEATKISERFEGFGPNVYLMKLDEWKVLLGERRGKGVYWWLLSIRHLAVPRHVVVLHGRLEGEKDAELKSVSVYDKRG